MATATTQKKLGAFYTPPDVARALVRWVVRKSSDRLLDPSCGDGRFLAAHRNSVGVDCDVAGVVAAASHRRGAIVHAAEFFAWATQCKERFDCAAGNPPFIRYQRFSGKERAGALGLCAALGAEFSGLTSSWAPFLVASAGLLRPGGRMAFLVPAEVGHAPYARPLVSYLAGNFEKVLLVAVREKLFPELSEDVWILYAEGFGKSTERIDFAKTESLDTSSAPPKNLDSIALEDWKNWNFRLRPYLLPAPVRELYWKVSRSRDAVLFGKVAKIGIGYVTGANDFFHLRPSVAKLFGIPDRCLVPSVRNARWLRGGDLTPAAIKSWIDRDEPVLLLRLQRDAPLEKGVRDYLDSAGGIAARTTFKCSNRKPWYVVPDVRSPDAFLSYMSGEGPNLVRNTAGCPCTNSIHAVRFTNENGLDPVEEVWSHPFVRLSCEVEGHPLGGGMLKLEPGESTRIVLPRRSLRLSSAELSLVHQGIETMRRWRHYE